MHTHRHEIVIYYHSDSWTEKKVAAHAKALDGEVLYLDIKEEKITDRMWSDILDKLGMTGDEIVDHNSEYYKAELEGREMSEPSWLKVLTHHPEIVKAPIALRENKAVLAIQPTDVLKLTTVGRAPHYTEDQEPSEDYDGGYNDSTTAGTANPNRLDSTPPKKED